ncbi:hypothetical protein [Stieleria tagensis]|uniref:hypothetical protein n=1 Tax=Stieleria tagensis TaxID=2956795 RepID=UPI00209AE348|nr:hypothetical protein [Stieleria tagensis]
MGIPQGIQKIRDVTTNRRGNHPGLERKPALKRIGDPANLESENPAIKAAAEVKQAEDMKAQKIKAIKYLAKMGCGCYDKEGKITDALLAAMDDCTPDVRLASIEAIEETASGECCKKCGSTSCCSEKVTKRLSEIAYERDDSGCMLEPNAEIRQAAARAMKVCCPNRATGPIEEDIPELADPEPETLPEVTPEAIPGEGEAQPSAIEGEGSVQTLPEFDSEEEAEKKKKAREDAEADDSAAIGAPSNAELTLMQSAQVQRKPIRVEVGNLKVVGGMRIQPVTITPVSATDTATPPAVNYSLSDRSGVTESRSRQQTLTNLPQPVTLPQPIALPIRARATTAKPMPTQSATERRRVTATVLGVDQPSGRVLLQSGNRMTVGASVAVYHHYLTGERLVAHLLIQEISGSHAIAVATDAAGLVKIDAGDRAVCF